MTEIKVPTLGESITEATVASWYKKVGDTVEADEPLVELETDKVTVEVPAPAAGTISEIKAEEGDTVEVGSVLGFIEEGSGSKSSDKSDKGEKKKDTASQSGGKSGKKSEEKSDEKSEDKSSAKSDEKSDSKPESKSSGGDKAPMPAAQRVIEENDLDASKIEGTGKDGRITKADALEALSLRDNRKEALPQSKDDRSGAQEEREERVRMSRLRQTIAQRLKDAQNTAAMLTTFNEVDMTAVMNLRNDYKDLFEKRHGVRLGFMAFFVKAVVAALKEIPSVNAEVDGTDIIYKHYYDIGVAVGTERGLIVPVLRDCDTKSFAQIEQDINDFGRRARDGKIGLDELQGGTFTISNGGVYGSLMSTPILNAPQSGILGMHKIQQRPVAEGGTVVVRPMMYLALSYDHRLVDGKEAVTFLVRVKEMLEDPQRALLDL